MSVSPHIVRDSAFPVAWQNPNGSTDIYLGITRRELFAAMAMQGMLSGPDQSKSSNRHIAEYSTDMADALIAELEKAK